MEYEDIKIRPVKRAKVSVLSTSETSEQTSGVDNTVRACAKLMHATSSEAAVRGTVASMIQEANDASREVSTKFARSLGTRKDMSQELQELFLEHYETYHPTAAVVSRTTPLATSSSTNILNDVVAYHEYAIVAGRRIKPSSPSGPRRASNSLVQLRVNGTWYVGEISSILSHYQAPSTEPRAQRLKQHLLHVRWLKPLREGVIDTDIWDPFPELEINFWEHGGYLDPFTKWAEGRVAGIGWPWVGLRFGAHIGGHWGRLQEAMQEQGPAGPASGPGKIRRVTKRRYESLRYISTTVEDGGNVV